MTTKDVEALIASKPDAQTVECHPAATLEWCNEVAAVLRAQESARWPSIISVDGGIPVTTTAS